VADAVRIELQPLGAVLEAERGAPLRDILFRYGVEFPCGGKGRCRGCRVKVLSGELAVSSEHAELLSPDELAAGWRLACRARAGSPLVLELAQWEMSVLADESTFEFTPAEGFGVAIDLGTTTLAVQLVDLASGGVAGVETALNPQVRFGNDIMSRIQHSLDPAGAAELRQTIREALGVMVSRLAARAGHPVTRIAIVGNTAMHHLFCGLDAAPLAGAPFETPHLDACVFTKSELGWELAGNPSIRFLECVGGFVGSDVLAGAVAMGIGRRPTLEGLIDLGTNGEIVFGARGRTLCASTAAGPAFEGGGISCGMRAASGAISEVWAVNGEFGCRVLGGGTPRGVCGSGLVDAVAAAIEMGMVQPGGSLVARSTLPIAPGVDLVQRDIRELQLAKAAIAAGAGILLGRLGASVASVAQVHLAGAFGNYINRSSAARIGLLEFPLDVLRPAGNTALLGARMALFSAGFECREFAATRRQMEHIPLASDPRFEETYVEKMRFAG